MPYKDILERMKQALTESHVSKNFPNISETSQYSSDMLSVGEKWSQGYSEELQSGYDIKNGVVMLFYVLIILVSFFGNFILCKIVFFNSNIRSTTNIFIGSLSISDLMMTVINIPIQAIKTTTISRNWPLDFFFCKTLPFIQALSVTISSLTMATIAFDRYQLIAHPLKAKSELASVLIKIILIWILAVIISLPYAILANLIEVRSQGNLTRCNIVYPDPDIQFRKLFTLISLFIQYIIPLTVSAVAYIKICIILWKRKCIGCVTPDQIIRQRGAKWKTIKMLMIVLIVFTLCWLPINVYHVYQDMREVVGFEKHKSNIYITCHLLAMSSVCYNPFIYFWLNEKFKKDVKRHVMRVCSIGKVVRPYRISNNFSRKFRTNSSLDRNVSCVSKTTNCSMKSREFRHSIDGTEIQLLTRKIGFKRKASCTALKNVKKYESKIMENFEEKCEEQTVKEPFLQSSKLETSV